MQNKKTVLVGIQNYIYNSLLGKTVYLMSDDRKDCQRRCVIELFLYRVGANL